MEQSRIFVDSNFFVALFNPEDSQHQKAKTISAKFPKSDFSFIISNYIFLEITTVLSQRIGREVSILTGKYLLDTAEIEIIHINTILHERSWQIFQQIKKKDMGLIDASNLAIMATEEVRDLLTFDFEDFAPLQKQYHFSLLK